LAATGTRFQRQIRTDRVRPPNARSRASIGAGPGTHSRGHSRNLSASSIASTSSTASSMPDDTMSRKRPPPLAIAQDGASRPRLSADTFIHPGSSPTSQYGFYAPQSPSALGTPTSATWSAGASSPRFSVQSPSSISRSSFYEGNRASARRLSVPSVPNPYTAGSAAGYPPPLFYAPMPSSAASTHFNGSTLASPTSSIYSHGRRESEAELDWRRRTWHPGTYNSYVQRPATSGLTYQQTPDDSRPIMASQPAASQITRLPGIESFDHAPPPPNGASGAQTCDSMQLDGRTRPLLHPSPMDVSSSQDDRRHHPAWEAGLHHNLNRLDIANATSTKHTQSYVEQASAQRSGRDRPTTAPHSGYTHASSGSRMPAPVTITHSNEAKRTRRQAWYGVPTVPPHGSQPIMITQQRISPEDSGSSDGVPTPGTSQGTELQPAIMHANGSIELQPPGSYLTEEQHRMLHLQQSGKPEPVRADSGSQLFVYPAGAAPSGYNFPTGQPLYPIQQQGPAPAAGMGRLEALVAVATSEGQVVENRS